MCMYIYIHIYIYIYTHTHTHTQTNTYINTDIYITLSLSIHKGDTHKGDTHWQFRLFPPHIIPYYKYFTSTILLRNGGFGSFFRIYNFTTNTLLLQCYHEHSTLLIGDIQRRLRLFLPHWRRQALKVSKVLLYSKLHY
jgi:hypothetical protein